MRKQPFIARAAAFLASAAMLCYTAVPAYAEFVDPAEAYARYVNGGYEDSVPNTAGDNNSLADDDEVPAQAEKVTLPEAPTGSGVLTPAEEVTLYSYRSSVEVGESFRIGYKLSPSKSDDFVTYSVSNGNTISVTQDGVVTGIKPGTAVVTVKASSGAKGRFSVTVKETPVEADEETVEGGDFSGASAIELDRSVISLTVDETYQIRYALKPENARDTVTYRSIASSVATVSEDGVITAVKPGSTGIVCTTGSGVYARITVTVVEKVDNAAIDDKIESEIEKEYNDEGQLVPSKVRFADESESLSVGTSKTLDARIYPSGAVFTYEIVSSDPEVVSVTHDGKITGMAQGNAIITLTTNNGKTDSIYITVYDDVLKGIDVSKWNGDVEWETVKRTGRAQFAMIRASYGYEDEDTQLENNVRGCEMYNIPYGFYHYTYAKNVSEAKKEAAFFLNVISRYSPKYPVVLDIEEDFYKQMDPREVTDIVVAFVEMCESAGYYTMIYSYAKFFEASVYMDELMDYDIWVACWGGADKLAENYSYHYGMWQYSESGTMSGIPEDVDLNYAYKDYEAIIKKYGLNNLG